MPKTKLNPKVKEMLGLGQGSTGPQGGNVEAHNAEWRRADFRPQEEFGLHKFEDTAIPGRKNEQPWHRMAAYMLLSGHTNKEIAAAAGVGPGTVSQLRAQRWFQELLATLANDAGDAVLGLLEAEAVASLEKIVSLRDGAEDERIQLTAATTLIEHYKGKPHQTITQEIKKVTQSPQEEYAALQKELLELRQATAIEVPAERSEAQNVAARSGVDESNELQE